MVCSFEIYQPVATIYNFNKTLLGKKAERERRILQLSPGAPYNWRSDRSRTGVERPEVKESQRTMLLWKWQKEVLQGGGKSWHAY